MSQASRRCWVLVLAALLSWAVEDGVWAQRGHGRGGGVSRGRAPVNRSPSMSRMPVHRPTARPATRPVPRPTTRPSRPAPRPTPRPTTRPATVRPSRPAPGRPSRPSTRPVPSRPATRPAPGSGPSSGELRDFLKLPGGGAGRPGTRPSGGRPSLNPEKIRDRVGVTPGTRPAMPDWFRPGAAIQPSTPPSTRPVRPGDRPTTPGDRPSTLPAVRPPGNRPPVVRPPGTRPPGTRPPGHRPPIHHPVIRPPGHWPHRPWHPGHPAYRPPGYWWHWASVGAVTGWIVHSWASPVYYSYGPGGSVYYEGNVVYINGDKYGSAEEYYEEVTEQAASAPEIGEEESAKVEWLPLGVYALTSEGVNASHMYLQLAVTKEGVISGTFFNETTGAVHPVEGLVDRKTQRAAWKVADGTNPDIVMETGIYNLTREQTDVLVHFGPQKSQTWKLVRLKESERPQVEEKLEKAGHSAPPTADRQSEN